jgi:hypothetical protein
LLNIQLFFRVNKEIYYFFEYPIETDRYIVEICIKSLLLVANFVTKSVVKSLLTGAVNEGIIPGQQVFPADLNNELIVTQVVCIP